MFNFSLSHSRTKKEIFTFKNFPSYRQQPPFSSRIKEIERERWKEIDRRTRRINRLWIERARMNKKICGKIELESIER